MHIQQDPQITKILKDKLVNLVKANQRKPDGKYHVSDLLNPRFAYFNQQMNYLDAQDDDVYMFLPGIAFHKIIQEAFGVEMAEKEVALEDIVGTVDIMGVQFLEIKTSRKYTIPEAPDEHYVSQFEKYLAMAGRLSGHIVVIYFVAGRDASGSKPSALEIRSWKVTITPEEAREIKNNLLEARNQLNLAIKTKNPSILPLCWVFKCGNVYKDVVTRLCPFYSDCKPAMGQDIRYPLPELKRVLGNKMSRRSEATNPRGNNDKEYKETKTEIKYQYPWFKTH